MKKNLPVALLIIIKIGNVICMPKITFNYYKPLNKNSLGNWNEAFY